MRAVLLVVVLAGCYLQYPGLPKSKPITPIAGATAEIPRDEGTINKSCGTDDTGRCKGKLSKKVNVVTGEPTYNGQKVSHYQFRMLVDPEFPKKMDHIRKLKSTCNISIVPTLLSGVALGVALYIGAQKEEHYSRNAGIAVGVGLGFYALSYPIGGYACVRARSEWRATGVAEAPNESYVYISDDKDEAYLAGLQELAAKFNANGGATATTPPVPETPPAPTETTPPAGTPPAVAAGSKNIVDALKAQGGYLAFLTIVECAGKEAELASGSFTVLAFDDETVRKQVKSSKDRKKFKDNCVKIYNAHVAAGALPASAFKVGEMVEVNMINGTSNQMKVRDGHRVIEATNGVIYTLDEVLSGWR